MTATQHEQQLNEERTRVLEAKGAREAAEQRLREVSERCGQLNLEIERLKKKYRIARDEALDAVKLGAESAPKLREAAEGLRGELAWTRAAETRLALYDLADAERALIVASIDERKQMGRLHRAAGESEVARQVAVIQSVNPMLADVMALQPNANIDEAARIFKRDVPGLEARLKDHDEQTNEARATAAEF